MKRRTIILTALVVSSVVTLVLAVAPTARAANKPNILVIFGDDVGTWNVRQSIKINHRTMVAVVFNPTTIVSVL